jgi:acetyl esterase/lipase
MASTSSAAASDDVSSSLLSPPRASLYQEVRPPASAKVLCFPNIPYYKHARTRTNPKQLDVYVRNDLWRARSGTLPVVVYLHGGAWLLGDKDLHNSQGVCHHLALTGEVVAISVSYTLTSVSNASLTTAFIFFTGVMGLLGIVSNFKQKAYLMSAWLILSAVIMLIVFQRPSEDVRHPCHVLDCAHAVRWVRDHIADFGGDPRHLIIMGHSAGAHLASLLSSNPRYLEKVGMSPRDLTAAVCISGVYNDRALADGGVIARSLLYETFGHDREVHSSAFPIHHADPSICPPFFLLNAWRDVSLKRHAKEFRSVLIQNQVYVDSRVYPSTNHYSIILQWDRENHHVLLDILTFIERAIAAKGRQADAVAAAAAAAPLVEQQRRRRRR